MAIVQISRIQHRRGRKNQGTGMPQLASAELGWAVDSQELYIGNGSVSEGAPFVGNTKILTENDNIFDYAAKYAYKPTDGSIWSTTAPVYRDLQTRLDDFVSVKAFGAVGDGVVDDTDAIQAVLDMYLGSTTSDRNTVYFPAGVYLISSPLKVPPYASLVGAGKEKTIIKNDTGICIETVNGSSTPGNYNPSVTTSLYAVDGNQARYINIEKLSFETSVNDTCIKLLDCSNSVFSDIKLNGPWAISASGFTSSKGIELQSTGVATCENNTFEKIEVDGYRYSVYSDFDIKDNRWTDCLFYMAEIGIAFGANTVLGSVGQATGPTGNIISKSKFDMIAESGFEVINGSNNSSQSNKYYNVGNDGGSSAQNYKPIIRYSGNTNICVDDFFLRTAELTPNSESDINYRVQYVPEVLGSSQYNNPFPNTVKVGFSADPKELLKFPLIDGIVEVEYVYTDNFNNLVRTGTIEITGNTRLGTASINDDFTYNGPDVYQDSITWTVTLHDYGSYGDGLYASNKESVCLNVENTLATSSDEFKYSIRVKT